MPRGRVRRQRVVRILKISLFLPRFEESLPQPFFGSRVFAAAELDTTTTSSKPDYEGQLSDDSAWSLRVRFKRGRGLIIITTSSNTPTMRGDGWARHATLRYLCDEGPGELSP